MNTIQRIQNLKIEQEAATYLIAHKDLDEQISLSKTLIKRILELPDKHSYKTDPDIFGIWPEDMTEQTIKIEQVHKFIKNIQLKPYKSKCKVGIITQAEKLTLPAQNALLKTLEEPPQNTFVILTTTDHTQLLPTIISRCCILSLPQNSTEEINTEKVKLILHTDIVERFQLVEKILKTKDRKKAKEDARLLALQLTLYLEKKLQNSHTNPKKLRKLVEIIELIELTQSAIDKHVNMKLALENLMINIPCKGIDF